MRSPLSYFFGSTSVLLLSLVSAFAPALAGEGFTPAHRYPKQVLEGAMNGCMAQRGNVDPEMMGQLCFCILQAAQDKFSLAQLLNLSNEMSRNQTISVEVKEISTGCAMAVLKANSK
jgi:hypothetical protein